MRVYSRRESNPLKWVLAAILFIVVMTFTMAEVNGYPVSPKPSDGGSASTDQNTVNTDNTSGTIPRVPERPTTVVPEPGTLLLMATGLGAAYLFRKTRKANG